MNELDRVSLTSRIRLRADVGRSRRILHDEVQKLQDHQVGRIANAHIRRKEDARQLPNRRPQERLNKRRNALSPAITLSAIPAEVLSFARRGKAIGRAHSSKRVTRRTRTQGMFWGSLHPTHEGSGVGCRYWRLPVGKPQGLPPHENSGRSISAGQSSPKEIPNEKH